MSRIIVTGATGFLGAEVSRGWTGTGPSVVRTDRQATEDVLALDVTDPQQLDDLFALNSGASAVVHLAAAGSGQDGLVAGADGDPASAVRVNIEGFVQVAEAAARHNISRVVWASSTTVYGPASNYGGQQIPETASFAPTTLYGSTKVACEHLGPVLAAKHDIDIVSLRLPMVYGPGRWYGGSQAALVSVAEAARKSEPLNIFCWTNQTDWIHVEDAATAIRKLVEAPQVGSSYHVVGHRGSLHEIASEIAAVLGLEASGIQKDRLAGPDLPLTDDSQIRTRHNWTPLYPSASSGAETFIES